MSEGVVFRGTVIALWLLGVDLGPGDIVAPRHLEQSQELLGEVLREDLGSSGIGLNSLNGQTIGS